MRYHLWLLVQLLVLISVIKKLKISLIKQHRRYAALNLLRHIFSTLTAVFW